MRYPDAILVRHWSDSCLLGLVAGGWRLAEVSAAAGISARWLVGWSSWQTSWQVSLARPGSEINLSDVSVSVVEGYISTLQNNHKLCLTVIYKADIV